MSNFNFNSIIETLAPVIANKNEYRAVIDYVNGDTILIDFSNSGEPFENKDTLMVWTHRSDHGANEVGFGSVEYKYEDVFKMVKRFLSIPEYRVKDFYYETF